MKKIMVSLGMITRKFKNAVVEVPDDFDSWDQSDQEEMLANIYSADDESNWHDDTDWGCEPGTHTVIGSLPKEDVTQTEFVVNEFKEVIIS